MAIHQYKVKELVDGAVGNTFGMPEFQRGFVWEPNKVREMVVSLHNDYPIGTLLLWRQPQEDEPPTPRVSDTNASDVWVVDGQQRTTGLCLLFGRRPYWWKNNDAMWNSAVEKYDIRVNLLLGDEVVFQIPKRSVVQDPSYISLRKVLTANDGQIQEMAEELNKVSPETSPFAILQSLQKLRAIGEVQIPAFEESKELEDIVEIYIRLNQRGTRVNEGDIVRAKVSAENPTWIIRTFEPFLDELKDSGFELEPTLIFRSLIAEATGYTRFKYAPAGFWSVDSLNQLWPKVERAWRAVIDGLNDHGILNVDVLPTRNALIPLVVMAARFPGDFSIGPALSWLIRASCLNRYSRTTDTRLAQDVKVILEKTDFISAVQAAISTFGRLDFSENENEYFLGSYRDGAVQLMLYLLAYANKAHDWGASQERIGFAGAELLQKFNPEWHHIFPQAYLKGNLAYSSADCAANIVAIRKETNIKIGKNAPMDYMKGISDNLLSEQYVPTDRQLFDINSFNKFLELRAASLAKAANEFVSELESGLAPAQQEAA